jgi:hypothetical protein
VVLWFEHDAFDQLILARILAFYAEHGVPRRLELVQVNRFPGVERFKGLGELSAAALRMLWDDRRAVGSELLDLGTHTWDALREPSPLALFETTRAGGTLPELGAAVLRHLQELPWQGDGLSLTERHVLELAAERAASAGEIFVRLSDEREASVHLGLSDSMFLATLDRLVAARQAPIAVAATGAETPWHRRTVTTTAAGRRILSGELDYLDTGPAERWVGGVRVGAKAPDWRWSPSEQRPMLG